MHPERQHHPVVRFPDPPGPAPIEVTEQHLRIIEKMAGTHSLDDIAWVCGISPSTLDRWKQREDVTKAYNLGKVMAVDRVAQSLIQAAMDGDTTAAIWFLKVKGQWREPPKEEKQPEKPGSNVIIMLPDNRRSESTATENAGTDDD